MPSKTVGRIVLDERDQRLLNTIQTAFPLDSRPFLALAAHLDETEDAVMRRYQRLKDERVIRQVSAIFDTRKLGYRSSLVATSVPETHVQQAADMISAHPGVSHNYRRDHEFNIWWTIAVPPHIDLQTHVNALHRMTAAISTRVLPTLKLYKIGVDLDVSDTRPMDAQTTLPTYRGAEHATTGLTTTDIDFIRVLQDDLAVIPEPFAHMAEKIGTTEQAVIAAAEQFIADERMRRFAAVLHHRRAGFGANAMSVWQVPPDDIDPYGYKLAGYAAVSHCYRRPTYPDWPYALFGMIHGTSKERVEEAVAAIRRETGLEDYRLLYSTAEFKKIRVRYFDPAYDEWATAHVRAEDVPAEPATAAT
jgi:DNA-binding Lrp family transcriptional regulator